MRWAFMGVVQAMCVYVCDHSGGRTIQALKPFTRCEGILESSEATFDSVCVAMLGVLSRI